MSPNILFYIAIKGMGYSLPFIKRHMLFFGYVSFLLQKRVVVIMKKECMCMRNEVQRMIFIKVFLDSG